MIEGRPVTDTTTPERWRRVKTIASGALDLDESARDVYLAGACGGDDALVSEVRSLLACTLAAAPFFESPGSESARSLLPAGTAIGPYRIVRELASGGMGSVYLAERDDEEFHQRVAIKVVRGGFASAFLLQRFREERRILASLDHPNIARLLDGGATVSGLPYVVMEFVEGQPVDAFCASRGLSLRERLAVFQQVCAAVQHAHQHLVIHRDIKAANILVTADGTPKLLDFGIARLLDPQTGVQFDRQTTLRVMTPESASPEQVSGGAVTVASDVYALGVLLYRLLTERGPYRPPLDSETQVICAVCEQVPERPSAVVANGRERIPDEVDRIVLKALRKEPERRYGSPGQLADDIQRFLDGRPVLAMPDSLRYRARKFAGRHGLAVTAAAAVIVAVVAGVAATAWQARVAERERQRAEHQFNAVRGLAQSVLGELHDAVQKLPGSTTAREILLRRGTEYLDTLYAEARTDPALRRELADGYIRLASVQGTSGLPNLGDRSATSVSLRKAVTMLEPLAAADHAELGDRLNLAFALVRLSSFEAQPDDADADRSRARAIVDALTPAERSTARALTVRQTLWTAIAQQQLNRRDYAAAKASYAQVRDAGEEGLRLSPGNLDASRNLSLAYKQLGATMEMVKEAPAALALYEKALDLDQRRVAAEPSRPIWRLDLSFAHGAMGAALLAQGDLAGARGRYEEAVALREQVVRDDPGDDFARLSLARGYERLATVRARLGDAEASIGYSRKRVQVYRDRLDAHPERDNVWKDYTQAAFSAAQSGAALLAADSTTPPQRGTLKPQVAALLDRVVAARDEWTRTQRSGSLPPDDAAIAGLRAQLR